MSLPTHAPETGALSLEVTTVDAVVVPDGIERGVEDRVRGYYHSGTSAMRASRNPTLTQKVQNPASASSEWQATQAAKRSQATVDVDFETVVGFTAGIPLLATLASLFTRDTAIEITVTTVGFAVWVANLGMFAAITAKAKKQRSGKPALTVDMHPALASVWSDWLNAYETIRKLPDASEAYEAVLANDDAVRATISALHANGFSLYWSREEEERDEIRMWLYRTCAKAHVLAQMEAHRAAVRNTLLATTATPAPQEASLDAALVTSNELTATVRAVLT